jgi:signal transduction histidine kinase
MGINELNRTPGAYNHAYIWGLSVADTGVGIAAEDMRRLFTSGGHGTHSTEVNPESTGYGLYIAKRIVDAHEGHLWAQSGGPGTGSRFIMELPLAAQ